MAAYTALRCHFPTPKPSRRLEKPTLNGFRSSKPVLGRVANAKRMEGGAAKNVSTAVASAVADDRTQAQRWSNAQVGQNKLPAPLSASSSNHSTCWLNLDTNFLILYDAHIWGLLRPFDEHPLCRRLQIWSALKWRVDDGCVVSANRLGETPATVSMTWPHHSRSSVSCLTFIADSRDAINQPRSSHQW